MRDSTGNTTEINRMDVTVIRKQRVIDRVFTASTATLVALIYVNFGCALDWPSFRSNLKKPIGPAIGFFTQFGIMPVVIVSYLTFIEKKICFCREIFNWF